MRLYFKYLAILFKSKMQYKASFFMTAAGQFIVSFSAFFGVYFMFDRFSEVDGYTFSEVLICFAAVLMAFSLAECFFRGFDTFPKLIKSGTLDRILVRPRSVIFQVLTSTIEFTRIGRFLQAAVTLGYAIPTSGVEWTFDKVMTLIMMIVGGMGVYSALFILYAGISFFTIDGLEFMNVFTDGTREFGKYPLSIYGKGILGFFTYVIPIALFQYYPFLYLVGRTDDLWYAFLPLIGLVFLLPCYAFFAFGLSRYKSTGS